MEWMCEGHPQIDSVQVDGGNPLGPASRSAGGGSTREVLEGGTGGLGRESFERGGGGTPSLQTLGP